MIVALLIANLAVSLVTMMLTMPKVRRIVLKTGSLGKKDLETTQRADLSGIEAEKRVPNPLSGVRL
jgi:hypothetical protein